MQLSLLGAVTLAFSILLFTAYSVREQSAFALNSMSSQAQTLGLNVANAAGNYMIAEDFSVIEELLLQSAAYRDVISIQVSDQFGQVVGHVVRDENNIPHARFDITELDFPAGSLPITTISDKHIVSWHPIENASIGWVKLEYSLDEVIHVQGKIWRNGIVVGITVFFASMLLLLLFLKRPIKAIENATDFAKRLYRATGETIPVERSTYEVEQLEYALNYAATKLYSANKDLSDMKFALDEHAIVGITDSNGRITYANDKFCEISQYTQGELLGNTYSALNSGTHGQEFYNNMWSMIDSGRVWHGEVCDKRKDGSHYWVDTTIIPFLDENDEPYQFISIQTDISVRKDAENKLREYQEHLEEMVEERTNELQIANRELESFCYSVSHDLRAPLRSIDGFSQALIEDYAKKLDENGKDYLGRVRSSSQRMGELIDDLLNLSRVVRSDMSRSSVDLSSIARTIEKRLREYPAEREVEFIVQEGITADGDERLLMAMLENLLGNAWKFTSNEEVARIEFGCRLEDGSKVFYVTDNGAGFDPAYAHKLFEPFQRLHSAKEFEGSGIGLATVQRVIRRHGGEVWAEGEVGKGTTINFTLE